MGFKIRKGADLSEDDQDAGEWSEAEQSAYAAESPDTGREKTKITKQMKDFIEGIVEGKSQFHAYRSAYPNAQGSDRTIRQNAYKLSKHPGVIWHLEQRQGETAEVLATDLNAARLHVIRGLITHSVTGKQEGTRLKALELIGKATGLFSPQTQTEKAVVSVADLRKELDGHLKTLERVKPAKQTLNVYTDIIDAEEKPVAESAERREPGAHDV
jgi:hypothetical protein